MIRPPAKRTVVVILLALAVAGCDEDKDEVWTLYRSSPIAADLTIHVATFDATEGRGYNRDGCIIARDLLQQHSQAGQVSRYWCERGWASGAQGRKAWGRW